MTNPSKPVATDNGTTIKNAHFRLNLNQFNIEDLPAATITIVGTVHDSGRETPSGLFAGAIGHGQLPALLAVILDAAMILRPELSPELDALRSKMTRLLLA